VGLDDLSAELEGQDQRKRARAQMSIASALSVDVAFTTDEVVFRFKLRVDGQQLWASAIPPANCSGIFVLGAR
jgi:hypothetical protein